MELYCASPKHTTSIPKHATRRNRAAAAKIDAKVEESRVLQRFEEFPEGKFQALVMVRWSEPVDQNCDLVDAAIQIIAPAEDKERVCRRFVADGIQLLRMQIPTSTTVPNRKLRQLMRACRKVRALLVELPPSWTSRLLLDEFHESDLTEIRQGVGVPGPMRFLKRPLKNQRYAKLLMELEFIAKNIDLHYLRKKRGPKEDLVKLNAVQAAYRALIQYSSFAPTTTTAGPFYELSSIYYEAVTGLADVNMERQCRMFLKSGLTNLFDRG